MNKLINMAFFFQMDFGKRNAKKIKNELTGKSKRVKGNN